MGLWSKFRDLVEGVGGEQRPARNFRDEELKLAAAALLVHASLKGPDMTAQKGKDLLLKVDANGEGELQHAGLCARSLAFNGAIVDITDQEGPAAGANCCRGVSIKRSAIWKNGSGGRYFKSLKGSASRAARQNKLNDLLIHVTFMLHRLGSA
jgi:hypothetical protein